MMQEIKINNITYHLYDMESKRTIFPYFRGCYEEARKNKTAIFALDDYIYNILCIREYPWHTEFCVLRYRKDDCYCDTDGWLIPPQVAAFKGVEIAVVWEGK